MLENLIFLRKIHLHLTSLFFLLSTKTEDRFLLPSSRGKGSRNRIRTSKKDIDMDQDVTVNGIKVPPHAINHMRSKSRRRKEDIQGEELPSSGQQGSSSSWTKSGSGSGGFNSCLEIECEAGGTCISDPVSDERYRTSHHGYEPVPRGRSIRCRCPLGRKGQFCEKRESIHILCWTFVCSTCFLPCLSFPCKSYLSNPVLKIFRFPKETNPCDSYRELFHSRKRIETAKRDAKLWRGKWTIS